MASKPRKQQDLKSNTDLSVEYWPIDRLVSYARNARIHDDAQVTAIAASIKEFGFVNPVLVDRDGVLIAGHGRILACRELGMDKVPVIKLGYLTENQAKALRITDNQLPTRSTWNAELLRVELTELSAVGFEMKLLGFDDVQLVSFMASVPTGGDPDAVLEPPKKAVSKLGDVWIMGKHRLLCGDSTKKEDVERVLNGEEPNLMVTDPPYGVNYEPIWRDGLGRDAEGKVQRISSGKVVNRLGAAKANGAVQNDDRADWREAWNLFDGDVAYVWHGGLHAGVVQVHLEEAGLIVRAQIIWNKQTMVFGRGDYHWKHEPCWYAVRKGSPGRWSGDRKQTTVWDIQNHNPMGGNREEEQTGHGTQKPVECMKRPIENSSRPGEFVYEPFSGSGTTLIACEMTTRYCLAVELAPQYVDMGVLRWQTLTKQDAVLESDGRTFAEIAKDRAKKKPAPKGKPSKPVRKARADQVAGAA